jgi:endonuclease/exonuclease/phosphatase family metal-dependent hydrolase
MTVNPLQPKQAKLSELKTSRTPGETTWTSENLQILPEPEDNFLSEETRKDLLRAEYLQSLKEKVRVSSKMEINPGSETGQSQAETTVTPSEVKQYLSLTTPLTQDPKDPKMTTAGIGSFNIEWLGTKKRSKEDYKTIAQVIKDVNAAVLGVQEVCTADGIEKVLEHLPNFGYILGKSNQQMVGVIFDKTRVKYDPSSIEHIDKITLGNEGLRAPLSLDMKVDNYDFNFTVLHFKARFDKESVKTREKQAELMNKWLVDKLETDDDKDYIVVGDYNDMPGSNTLKNLGKGNTVVFPTENSEGKDIYSNIAYKSLIDHAALSSCKKGASEEYIKGSLRTVNEKNYKNYDGVSDHKPIVFDIRSDEDND